MSAKTRTAVYGGSFNPPHLGHMHVVEALINSGFCDEIWLMPAISREHMRISTPPQMRVEMLKIILSEIFPQPSVPVIISDFEIGHTKEITTYQIKIELEQKFSTREFLFVLGSDVLPTVSRWIDGNKLLVTSKFILVPRKAQEHKDMPQNILLLKNFESLDISSTKIRFEIKKGADISKFVTPKLHDYITAKKLYQV
jgi:nicotinate-nucleotide adenylyltransferase